MNEVAEKQRTLLDALERLGQRASFADEIAGQSRVLIEKIERTEDCPVNKGTDRSEPPQKTPNLIELFDQVSSRLEYSLETIAIKIERAKNLIG